MERSRKRELRDLNRRAWAGDTDVFAVSGSLDSSMKKNTAFIRRLRTPASATIATILQEIKTLSLHKYLSEIISACYEGFTKLKLPADIAAGVEIFSALHQRFGPEEFTRYIGWHIGRGLSTPDKAQLKALPQDVKDREEKERLPRQRVLLRVATELWLVGGLRSLDDIIRPEEAGKAKEGTKGSGVAQPRASTSGPKSASADAEPFPLEVLKEITSLDTQHASLSMVSQYAKAFSWDLFAKRDAETDQSEELDPPLVDAAMQQRFKNILVQYFEGAKAHIVRDQVALNSQGKRNAEAYVRSGEIFEDRQANFEKMQKSQEKFTTNMQMLADILELEMPDLKDKDAAGSASDGAIGLVKTGEYLRGEGDGAGIWEDEDERRFYENLIDLKDRVPGILLEDAKKKKSDGEDRAEKKTEDASKPADVKDSADAAAKDGANSDQSTAIANKTVGAQVDALLARLPEATNKEAIDEIAVDFCFVNSKASRNRLIKAVQEVPRGRSDLLPLYSRLVTTLGKYMPDITQNLVQHLDEEFRSLQRRKQKDTLGGVRTSNIRYLAELTKFGVVPEHVIFHCLKVSLDEFSRMNIEIICNLLENCGRYLLRNPETQPRMKSFLETLLRKKSAQHLGQQERMLIENATYTVDPPERAAILQKEKTPLDLFVRKLIYIDLNKRNVERIIKQIRKLHWEEEEVVTVLHKIFARPAKMKYGNINFLAIILGSLNRYHQEFTISVVDDVLESITLGLELNDFKFNRRRLADVRYFGELYVYRVIDSSIVFDTMFRILTFGHGGWPKPGQFCPLDPPDDFFRIRLVSSILETCGMYYDKGAAKKKLDFFLTFFQYYIRTKEPMPMSIEFVVQDAFALVRPQWKLAPNLEEAGAALAEASKEHAKSEAAGRPAEATEDNDNEAEDLDEDGEAEADGRRTPAEGDENSSSEDEAEDLNENDDQPKSPDAESDEEEHITVTRPEDERDPEAEAEFDRELAKMMSDSVTENRKTERKPVFDVALPMRRAQAPVSATDEAETTTEPVDPSTIKFSLLSKRGNKPQTRNINLPADSTFAVAMRTQREAERAEQQRIKALVLNYDLSSSSAAADGHADALDGNAPNDPYIPPLEPNLNHVNPLRRRPQTQPPIATRQGGRDDSYGGANAGQRGGHGSRRQQQQARKLQLSDVDW